MAKYVMSLDAGTTSCRAILFDKFGNIKSVAQKEFGQIYPKAGWVEHDANGIWSAQLSVAVEAMAQIGANASDIASIGITNQRETTVVWDAESGTPIHNAIVWQCRRTAKYCDQLKRKGLEKFFRQKTGLVLDAYFSATKLKWILDKVPSARRLAREGKLLFGTIETWLIWKLTSGKVHATDYSNASRTMMFNISTLDWDDEILQMFDIPREMLPKLASSSEVYGECDSRFFGAPIPIGGAAGDQQAALFGQACFNAGDTKNTYGTGCFLLMNTGEKIARSSNGLLSTIAWGIGGKVYYALEGSVFSGGASIQWLRDGLKILDDSADSNYLATKVPDTNGCYLVPAFAGLGAPYWDQYARGTIVGLTRGTNKYHIVRATLESIAYSVNDVLKAMQADSHLKIKSLKVDGGASANDFLMQFQSDISSIPVARPVCRESTALGAAYLAGLAVGFWSSIKEISKNAKVDKNFSPNMPDGVRKKLLSGWKRAVTRSFDWAK